MPRAEATRATLLPGSAAAARLFRCPGAAAACQWQAHLDAYTCAVATVGSHRKKRKQLCEWNEFLAVELPQIFRKRGHLTLEDMETVMNWKITKHTFRPLMGQLKSNSPSLVVQSTAEALTACAGAAGGGRPSPNAVKKSMAALCKLRGVGPATASAVLAHVDGAFPFMADEALEGCGLERKYDMPTYLKFMDRLQAKADELGGDWTAEHVGRALWTAAMAHVHDLKITAGCRTAPAPQVLDEGGAAVGPGEEDAPTPMRALQEHTITKSGSKRKAGSLARECGAGAGGSIKRRAARTAKC